MTPWDPELARRVFSQHAQAGRGLAVADVPKLLSCCGLALTSDEVAKVLNQFKSAPTVSEAQFLAVAESAHVTSGDPRREVSRALYDFVRLRGHDSDFIARQDLRLALTKIGQGVLSGREVDEFFARLAATNVSRNSRGELSINEVCSKALLL